MWRAGIILAGLWAAGVAQAASNNCAECHLAIWESYRRTGMGRSFSRPVAVAAASYYHTASDSHFEMVAREGNYFQRRYQLDSAGRKINVLEKQVDYVMGSGNHARVYLHRTERGTLIELPLGWYAEKGGYWAMNPGYDRPDHDGFRRPISYGCMFCHNGYPQIPAGQERPFAEPVYTGAMPEGIDCERCHGPGERHVRLARTSGAKAADVRGAIVNPARLSTERQMELCYSCHLETTSFPLPNAIQRYERGPFSYRPGEPLADFLLNFDHAPASGRVDKFELVNAGYRLRRSACFLKSNGKLLCTTCHNPHDVPRGSEAALHYTAVCRQCHSAGEHFRSENCVDCHMPKRRTEDVVHVVATDHYIQRRKPSGDLLAELAEKRNAYRGPVTLYYPELLGKTPENDLYLATAQVSDRSNLAKGIERLSAALARYQPARPEFYFALAEALRDSGELPKAISQYREAMRRDPKFALGFQKLGAVLRRSGQAAQAVKTLEQAVSVDPGSAPAWHELGMARRAAGADREAIAALEKAIALDPDLPEARNNLGILLLSRGDRAAAEREFREAIRLQPDYADAHGNLGNLIGGLEALDHFALALRLHPEDATTRYSYAMALGRARRFDEAQSELESALRTNPEFADAHVLLADLLMAKGEPQVALAHYRDAVRIQPDLSRAELGWGAALLAMKDVTGAVSHLQKAASGKDAAVREQAIQALRRIGILH